MVSWGAERELREKFRNFDINTFDINEVITVIDNLKNCYIRYWKNYRNVFGLDVIEAFCGEELMLPMGIDRLINKLGVVTATHDGCGFVGVSRIQKDDNVVYALYTCTCHPWGDVTVYVIVPPSFRDNVIKFANVVE